MLYAKVDTSVFDSAIEEFAKESRKDLTTVTREQCGILVGHLIAVTPPGAADGQAMNDRGGISTSAKKRGEANIVADIAKLFPTTRVSEEKAIAMVNEGYLWQVGRGQKSVVRDVAFTEADLRRVHKLARNRRTGRTRKAGGAMMALTRAKVLRAFIKEQKKKVGELNAGWLQAAKELKTAKRATPAWITRHDGAPGAAKVRDMRGMVLVTISNYQAWFPGNMEKRVELALRRRERGLEKAIDAMVERRARKASRRMASRVI